MSARITMLTRRAVIGASPAGLGVMVTLVAVAIIGGVALLGTTLLPSLDGPRGPVAAPTATR